MTIVKIDIEKIQAIVVPAGYSDLLKNVSLSLYAVAGEDGTVQFYAANQDFEEILKQHFGTYPTYLGWLEDSSYNTLSRAGVSVETVIPNGGAVAALAGGAFVDIPPQWDSSTSKDSVDSSSTVQ